MYNANTLSTESVCYIIGSTLSVVCVFLIQSPPFLLLCSHLLLLLMINLPYLLFCLLIILAPLWFFLSVFFSPWYKFYFLSPSASSFIPVFVFQALALCDTISVPEVKRFVILRQRTGAHSHGWMRPAASHAAKIPTD